MDNTNTASGAPAGVSQRGDWRAIALVIVILLVSAISFYPCLKNGFTNWDDNVYVTQNELIKDLSWHGVQKIFTSFYGGNYHPLVALTNAVEYRFWGLNPTPYHVVNLLFHLINTALVFLLIVLLVHRIEAAAIVALLFGIHPMHVESVAWIAERKDVLYACFYLVSLVFYIRYVKSGLAIKYLFASFVFLAISLFSKSAAVIAPASMILVDFYLKREWRARILLEKIPFALLALAYGMIALFSHGSSKALNTSTPFALWERVLITCHAIAFYIYKLVAPLNLSAFYNFPLIGPGLSVKYFVAPVVLLAIFALIYAARQFRRELLFGFGFYLINVILVVHIVSVGMTVVSERYAYVSYIGLFFIIAMAYCNIADGSWKFSPALKPILQCVLVGYALFCGVLTWQRCHVWKDSITLFSDALDKDKTSPVPYRYRGMAKYHTKDYGGAIADFDKAIALYAKDANYFLDRGSSKFALSDFLGARADFQEILKLQPDHPDGLMNIATTEMMLNNWDAALRYFNSALQLRPDMSLGYINRGRLYFMMNMRENACNDWQRALDLGYADAASMMNAYCKK